MSSKRKSQPTRIADELTTDPMTNMFPTFPSSMPASQAAHFKSVESDSEDIERLKALQQECLQSLLLQQQQQHLQSLSQLNKFVEPAAGLMQQQQKSMHDTLKCLKSLQLARSLENDTPRYFKFLIEIGAKF